MQESKKAIKNWYSHSVIFNAWNNFHEQLKVQGSHLQASWLPLEVDKQEVHWEVTEQEEEVVQELYLGSQEQKGRDNGGNLPWAESRYFGPKAWMIKGAWEVEYGPSTLSSCMPSTGATCH